MEIRKDTIQEIEERKLRWYSHVMRPQNDKLVKQIV
jgi:hypothetical protein